MDNSIGVVVGGTLNSGITLKLNNNYSVEDLSVGRYVTIHGKQKKFMGMITDVGLQVSDSQITLTPPDQSDSFSASILNGIGAYGIANITPYLLIGDSLRPDLSEPEPVKTIPVHFSKAELSSDIDFKFVFGSDENQNSFVIGNPLDMEYKLCLDIPLFVERSNGVFGKSGTGKTFFTRMLLGAMIQKGNAVNLIFDMHSEYGHAGTSEERGQVKGLKQFFPDSIVTLVLAGSNSTTKTDGEIKIDVDDIEPEDLAVMKDVLGLTDAAIDASYALQRRYGSSWIRSAIALNADQSEEAKQEFSETLASMNIHEATFSNLMRKIAKFINNSYINSSSGSSRTVEQILYYLKIKKNVIIEFGRYSDNVTYMLISNMLARRIYNQYKEETEIALTNKTAKPIPLVITIEEAHNFLNDELSHTSIFGTIAREMRKYNVTLLVIDQRPSGIQDEVLSQIGTKVVFFMDNEKDIDAALSGTSGKSALKSVLSRLSTKQQALIFGHAVPMPVSFKPRTYDDNTFYQKEDDNLDSLFC